jgi:toxin ParE1/3/4
VGGFRLTRRAEEDLLEIGEYTRRTWGIEQCARYLDQLEHCCQRLADNPKLGRAYDQVRQGYRRFEQGRHVVFFRQLDEEIILVVRILHDRMLPDLHLGDDEKDD